MFQRQSREPFPARNIILLAAVVLAFLVFLIGRLKKTDKAVETPATEQRDSVPQ